MTESWQRRAVTESPNSIPSNQAVLDWMIENAMNQPERAVSVGTDYGEGFVMIDVKVLPLSESEKKLFLELLDSAMPDRAFNDSYISLMHIIIETASDYFSGKMSAEEAARVIQSRASIFASEQFG